MLQILRRQVTEALRSEIVDYLSRFCDGFPDPRLEEFLSLSVGRILLKESRLGGDWRSVATDDQLHHIADWLKSSLINDDAWLSNVNYHGCPKKLMKFGSINQIVQEADRPMLKASQRLSGVKLVEGDEELYAELDDGYHIVRFLTPAALDRESAQMRHCIGGPSYDGRVQNDPYLYLSLRDASGKAHATMEIVGDTLYRLQGEQNTRPASKYLDRLVPFIKKYRFEVGTPVRIFNHVIDFRGHWHPIKNLPDNLTVNGSLNFRGADITRLPDGLTVGSNLVLVNTGITELPKGLTVGWDLDLRGSSITSLSEGLTVGNEIYLGDTCITSLPRGLSVGGSLDLRNTNIRRLPALLHVGGHLVLTGSEVTSLPNGLSVDGDLDLSGSKITHLPKGLSVGRSLVLEGLKIEELPDDLSVGADLNIRETLITRIPAAASVEGKIFSDNPLLELPPTMKCG